LEAQVSNCTCGNPAHGAFICSTCAKALEIALANISAYWQDLDNVRAKLVRYGDQAGRTREHPLPIDARFAGSYWVESNGEWVSKVSEGTALMDATRNTVVTWVRVVMDHHPVVTGPVCAKPCLHVSCSTTRRSHPPADNIPSCCNYLLGYADRARVMEWGPEMLDEMDDLEAQLRRLVDRPADRWFAGPCDQCARDLYAKTGAAEVACRECDLIYDVNDRRTWLLGQAEDRLVNATMLARAVSWLGAVPLTAARVWKWAERDRILVKGHETRGGRELPLYRIGDALDLLATDSQKAG
jgi:hypothetical protein